MPKLTEDMAKWLLGKAGMRLPQGYAAETSQEAEEIAKNMGKPVVLKALIPTGKRGKAGAVRFADTPEQAKLEASELLSMEVYGYPVRRIWVEEKIDIRAEYYLSIAMGQEIDPVIMVSLEGGVDIEASAEKQEGVLVKSPVPYLKGLPIYDAMDLWEKAGADHQVISKLAKETAELYRIFKQNDLLLLEINPLVLTGDGEVIVAAAMADIDDEALFRYPELNGIQYGENRLWRPLTSRERDVIDADLREKGIGAVKYTELDGGDIGLCVAGGGAGLMQHDLVLKYGGKPANHTDISPGPIERKMVVLLRSILTKPGVKSLLMGVNVMQLARVDVWTSALVTVLKELKIDPKTFPIVVRLSGIAEEEGKRILESVPGIIHYSYDVSLEEAVKKIVKLTELAKRGEFVG